MTDAWEAEKLGGFSEIMLSLSLALTSFRGPSASGTSCRSSSAVSKPLPVPGSPASALGTCDKGAVLKATHLSSVTPSQPSPSPVTAEAQVEPLESTPGTGPSRRPAAHPEPGPGQTHLPLLGGISSRSCQVRVFPHQLWDTRRTGS